MSDSVTLIGVELLVGELGPAVQAFTAALGCEVAWSGRSADVDGDVVVLDAGPITITLLSPTSTGGPPLPDTTPRLTQLVFGGDGAAVGSAVDALRALGIAVASDSGPRPYVPPGIAAGLLGARTALVLTVLDGDTTPSD